MKGSNFNLRGISPEILLVLKRQAIELKVSMNSLILKFIEQGIGYGGKPKRVTYHDLDFLIGTWSAKESQKFDESIKIFEEIDRELWG